MNGVTVDGLVTHMIIVKFNPIIGSSISHEKLKTHAESRSKSGGAYTFKSKLLKRGQ